MSDAAAAPQRLRRPASGGRSDPNGSGGEGDSGAAGHVDGHVDGSANEESASIAPLRQDLRHYPGPCDNTGAPSHVLHDPACDGYFHVGTNEFEMLARWHLRDPHKIADDICAQTTFNTSAEDVAQFEQQLRHGGLLRCSAAEIAEQLSSIDKNKPNIASRLANQILFLRIPLVRPQALLDKTLFLVAPFFMRSFWLALLLAFLAALYLIGRQWDVFIASLSAMANLNGALAISLALVISKSAHELAHGYSARRYGADVPVMGLAFILFWPLLYTETSNAWTVPCRKERIIIAAAGVAAELILAAGCFIAWPFLDPGPLRDAAGFAATTLIVLSLAFNANPLMRFDGYFILSEAVGIENMQPRGFEILKWHLRRLIAGVTLPYPEIILDRHERRILLLYGIASALYRIALYAGIVYAINLFLFPATALPLSAIILMTALIKPVLSEVSKWFLLAYRGKGWPGIARTIIICAGIASPLFIPWHSSVQVPVLISAGQTYDIFTTEPAQVEKIKVREGDAITAGTPLIALASPDLDFRLAQTRAGARALNRSIDRRLTRIDFHQGVGVSEGELAKLRSEISGLEARRAQLAIASPASGRVVMVDKKLRAGLWVRDDQPLMRIVAARTPYVVAYADERDMGFITLNAHARIWIEGLPGQSLSGHIETIYPQALKALDKPLMATTVGGAIAVRVSGKELIPELAIYKTRIVLDDASRRKMPMIETRGYAMIETAPRNLIDRIVERVIGLWRRELG